MSDTTFILFHLEGFTKNTFQPTKVKLCLLMRIYTTGVWKHIYIYWCENILHLQKKSLLTPYNFHASSSFSLFALLCIHIFYIASTKMDIIFTIVFPLFSFATASSHFIPCAKVNITTTGFFIWLIIWKLNKKNICLN